MWKSLSTIAICMSLSTSTYSAPKKINLPVPCFETKEVSKILEQHKEEYLFLGIDNMHGVKNLTTILFYNKETKTYSVILSVQDNDLACVITSGMDGTMLNKTKD